MTARWFIATIRNVSDKIRREHQNDILGLINFSWKSFRLWDNVRTARQAAVRFVWWVTRICCTYCFSMVTINMRTLHNISLYVHWNYCSILGLIALYINRYCVPCNLVTFTYLYAVMFQKNHQQELCEQTFEM